MVEGGIVLKPGLFIPYLEKIGFEMEKVVKIEKEKESIIYIFKKVWKELKIFKE